jgi:hypothetical protein
MSWTAGIDKNGVEHAPANEDSIAREIDLLVKEHGHDADIVAAKRADALFRSGDVLGGRRWLTIFRRLAMSNFGEEERIP